MQTTLIYDVVFKYILEDIEIARELLSTILGEEILNLDFKPQETATETPINNISILRFDFKAIIKTKTGELKKVLIELQKAKHLLDAMRFRRYLGDNYKKEADVLNDQNVVEKRPLPIVTIYFLGFPLDNIQHAVVKINREYRDVITQELIEVKEDFVELLTHDAYLIQLRLLAGKSRTKLEQVLRVFSLEYKTQDRHKLDFGGDMREPLVKKMVERLSRAIASEEIREKMDVEDEIDRIFERELRKMALIIAQKDQELSAKDQELTTKDQELSAKDQELTAKDQELSAEKQRTEALLKEIEKLREEMKK